MKIRNAVTITGQMLITSLRLLITHPYLLLYTLIPIAAPLVLSGVADYHRMFDLVLHYRPVMTSVTYALIGVHLLCTVWLSRRVVYLIHKKQPITPFVGRLSLMGNTVLLIALKIGGIYLFLRMAHWAQRVTKNPAITKYDQTYATLTAQLIPYVIFVMLMLALIWQLTLLSAPIIATERITIPDAIIRSVRIAWHGILPYVCIFFLFASLEFVPTFIPILVPRSYIYLKMIAPYGVQLLFTTLGSITYCVFYERYTHLFQETLHV